MSDAVRYDALIIGGGFYGCAIALHLRRRGWPRVLLVEREATLLARASYANQARVHNGYHYPRSFVTAYRSRINLPRFCQDYGFAVKRDFVSLYAIARRRSKVAVSQFERFMQDIGARYNHAPADWGDLFEPRLVAGVYVTEEYAFDAVKLREHFAFELAAASVETRLKTHATLQPTATGMDVSLMSGGRETRARATTVVNCTYANLNTNLAEASSALSALKHEIAELALVDPPRQLENAAVTLMDGPFFSCMPFPAAGCHSLSHVRYTPHGHLADEDGRRDPVALLAAATPPTKVHYMIADASRYVPCLKQLRYRQSLFEIKTVLARRESDDGRPILFRQEPAHPAVLSVLGGKIDNIYDILARLDAVLR